MKKSLFFLIGLFSCASLVALPGPFDLLNQYHEVHSLAYKLQDLMGTSLGDILLESGYKEDGIGGWEKNVTPNGNIVVQCKVVNGFTETTIKCTPSNATEQRSLFDAILSDFTEVLGKRPVYTLAGREWKDTSYGNILVMMFANIVTFSMTDTK